MYVCICSAVTAVELDAAIADGARCEEEVAQRTGAGTGCGTCVDRICDLLRQADPEHGRMPLSVAV